MRKMYQLTISLHRKAHGLTENNVHFERSVSGDGGRTATVLRGSRW